MEKKTPICNYLNLPSWMHSLIWGTSPCSDLGDMGDMTFWRAEYLTTYQGWRHPELITRATFSNLDMLPWIREGMETHKWPTAFKAWALLFPATLVMDLCIFITQAWGLHSVWVLFFHESSFKNQGTLGCLVIPLLKEQLFWGHWWFRPICQATRMRSVSLVDNSDY